MYQVPGLVLQYLLFETHRLWACGGERLEQDGPSENPSVPEWHQGAVKSGKVSLQPADPTNCGINSSAMMNRQTR